MLQSLSFIFLIKNISIFFKESKLMIAFRIKINASLTSSMTVQMWGEKKQNKRSVFPSLHWLEINLAKNTEEAYFHKQSIQPWGDCKANASPLKWTACRLLSKPNLLA